MRAETPETRPDDAAPAPTVGELATAGILSVEPDASLDEVAWLMANNNVHAVIVADDQYGAGPPLISDSDLIAAAESGRFERLCAADIAATEALSVAADAELDEAVRMLAEHRVTHLVVRDRRGAPCGILSTLDVARALADRANAG